MRSREADMKLPRYFLLIVVAAAVFSSGCQPSSGGAPGVAAAPTIRQSPADLLAGETLAVAYSGFRMGQHPDLGDGAVNPSAAEILEDLEILVAHDFRLIRLYDAGENSATTLELIRRHDLPIKVLQGIWLSAEVSNHEGCPWLDEPIPDEVLAANVLVNEAEIRQPVTVADNYEWWIRDGAPLAAEVDFLGVHTYPQWEEKTIDQALAYTVENIEDVRRALPGKAIVILEAGWATVGEEFGERASESQQARHFHELYELAAENNITVFIFAAFDEPWKGDPARPLSAEKHWGLFNVDRTPKAIFRQPGAAGDP
jgi:exo-beta-1,3-glucanase (GH17 family)